MTEEQLEKGKQLLTLISTTRDALNNVAKLLAKSNHYSLIVCEYSDGSGLKAQLSRKRGNTELLAVIETELKGQLAQYEAEFAAL